MASARSSSRFCPKCGRTDGAFIGMFCQSCYFKDHPQLVTVPQALEFPKCNYCGKICPQGKWVEWDDDLIKVWLTDKVKVKALESSTIAVKMVPNPKNKKEYFVSFVVNGTVESSPLEYEAHSTLTVRGGICNDDMLVTSNYYEGIIQVRFTDKTPAKVKTVQEQIDKALAPMQRSDSKAVVVNWIQQKFGLDAWIVSGKAAKTAAIAIQRIYSGTISSSGKLIGIDSHTAKTKNRMTYLVRIP